ncbi:MAG TPA: DNA-3-methyladenine glycosylase [Gemmataceae bacterium]|nr:DNA-3-methyladenine glycosylase [Gemmataceae bacterium]
MPPRKITANQENQTARPAPIPLSFTSAFRKARRHLGQCDPLLAQLLKHVGPCTLQPGAEAFPALVRAIIAQMISTKAAKAIGARVEAALLPHSLTPAAVVAASEETLRGAGLSRAKALALKDLAERTMSGKLPIDRLAELSDEEVIDCLAAVRGIGRWTAEMFLIFSLGRLDVLPVDDFGLRAAVRDVYQLPDLPNRASLRQRAEPWRPYRSIATWYFWRSRGWVPQSKE